MLQAAWSPGEGTNNSRRDSWQQAAQAGMLQLELKGRSCLRNRWDVLMLTAGANRHMSLHVRTSSEMHEHGTHQSVF